MPNLVSLDLHGAPADGFLEGDFAEVPEAFDSFRVRRVLNALPEGLEICPPGCEYADGPDFHGDVCDAIGAVLKSLGRTDVIVLAAQLEEGENLEPACWDWHEETREFY